MEARETLTTVPEAMFGAGKNYLVESVVRAIAEHHASDPSLWPSKYGVEIESETFEMHPFCWCEEEECSWCGEQNLPNFHYKPLDFKLWWYKYIGRGMEMNKELSRAECADMLANCLSASTNKTPPPPSS